MKKNGFTLVELIAVIVILIIIILLAVTAVKKSTDRANDNAINANAISYVKAVNEVAVLSRFKQDKIKGGIFTVEQTSQFDLSLSGDKPTGGYLYLEEFEVNCSCLEYGKYYIVFNNGKYNKVVKGTCPQAEDTCDMDEVYVNVEPVKFDFTGAIATFVAPKDGTYKLEVWGAQGGMASTYIGGYGAYSVGTINLKKNDMLYINVGGAGQSDCVVNDCSGGYNGGGAGQRFAGDQMNYVAGGGGATSIAGTSGLLSTLNASNIYIVAGAGGGAYYHTNGAGYSNNGASGGGYIGSSGSTCSYTSSVGRGGSQSAGGAAGYRGGAGSFGIGGTVSNGSSGGGGGYYGGGSAAHAGSGGGSGYIGNVLLSDKVMYCYNCQESSDVNTKTVSTTCVSETPTENCAKIGNGYAKISFLN